MKTLKTFLILTLFALLTKNLLADMPHYLDFKFIMNNSVAGKKVQENLQKMMEYDLFEFEDYCKNCYEFIEKRRPDQILQIWERAKVLNNV